MNDKNKFFEIVRARSDENERALSVLIEQECYALVGAILRMELDSLIRVHHFSESNEVERQRILSNFFSNDKWHASDRHMIENLPWSLRWAKHIYDFCCAFIHLSPYHDWATTHHIPNLTIGKRKEIVYEIKQQQLGGYGYNPNLEIDENFSFEDLIPFAPEIFKKLRGNLLCGL